MGTQTHSFLYNVNLDQLKQMDKLQPKTLEWEPWRSESISTQALNPSLKLEKHFNLS